MKRALSAPFPTRSRRATLAGIGLLLTLLGTSSSPPARAQAPAVPAPAAAEPSKPAGRLGQARSWGYQLQMLKIEPLAASPYDVLVIDYSRDGSDEGALTPAELAQLKAKPDGSRRIVLAYLSIGEAEAYRYYWKWTWGGRWYTEWIGWLIGPQWLRSGNAEWGGNYAVRYWDPRWQEIIAGPGGYLERIARAGFDGVWLDKVDSSIEAVAKARPTAQDDMRGFVARIARRGRELQPGFLVVPQNGEELLSDATYRATIDGIGKEDLLFGEFAEKKPNPADVIARRIGMLKQLTTEGKPVLAVEYVDDAGLIAEARRTLTSLGFIAHFADRDLAALRIGDTPPARASDKGEARRAKARKDAP